MKPHGLSLLFLLLLAGSLIPFNASGRITLTNLASFNGTNGFYPFALVQDVTGDFYGLALMGGENKSGTVLQTEFGWYFNALGVIQWSERRNSGLPRAGSRWQLLWNSRTGRLGIFRFFFRKRHNFQNECPREFDELAFFQRNQWNCSVLHRAGRGWQSLWNNHARRFGLER